MRVQHTSMMGRLVTYFLTGFLIALGQTADAQDYGDITKSVGSPAVSAHGIFMVVNGQDIGSSLLKACDTNQDGMATPSELNAALLNWFQQADSDSNGALSDTELATALKSLFPAPQPPPGAPPLPEDIALHNVLAKKLILTVDSNKDGWVTFQEALSFVSQGFSEWDADSNSSLDASELAAAFAQSMPPPPHMGSGPSLNVGFQQ